MKEYFGILRKNSLFVSIEDGDLASVLRCLSAEVVSAKKNGIVLLAGDRPEHVGVVLSGQLHIVKEDLDGNRTLVAAVTEGDVFAEALCCAGVQESPVTVVAETNSKIMLLRFDRILHACPSSCAFHAQLIENAVQLIARKNLGLQRRMDIISVHSVREKVLRYLDSFQVRGRAITIPFNREELANYLCVERSALSHELARMKRDGLIDYWKNRFTRMP